MGLGDALACLVDLRHARLHRLARCLEVVSRGPDVAHRRFVLAEQPAVTVNGIDVGGAVVTERRARLVERALGLGQLVLGPLHPLLWIELGFVALFVAARHEQQARDQHGYYSSHAPSELDLTRGERTIRVDRRGGCGRRGAGPHRPRGAGPPRAVHRRHHRHGPGPDGALVPIDLRELGVHMPFVHRLPIGLTVATFATPMDSSWMTPSDWVDIADALVEHASGHVGVVVLHGTDTMAYTASALSFLLDGIEVPIVLTGAQRPVTELRSDGRENLVAALAIAGGHHLRGGGARPRGDDLLRRRAAARQPGHQGPRRQLPRLRLAQPGSAGDCRDGRRASPRASSDRRAPARCGGSAASAPTWRLCGSTPASTRPGCGAVVDRPGLRGLVLEAYGAGNGPTDAWFLDPLREAVDRGVAVVRDHPVPGRDRARGPLRHRRRPARDRRRPRRRPDLRGRARQADGAGRSPRPRQPAGTPCRSTSPAS